MSDLPARVPSPRTAVQRALQSPWVNAPFLMGMGIILFQVAAALVVTSISTYGPREVNPLEALRGPSADHPFGTDQTGFDILTRVLYAPRVDFPVVGLGVLIALVAGTAIGLVAGSFRGIAGEVLMRVADLVQAFPALVLALALVALTGNSESNVVWVLGFVNTPIFLRLVRSQVLTIRELRFVEAATALGNSRTRVLFSHILPSALGPAITQVGISMSFGLLAVAGLAFLGVGIQPPTPEWGSMIQVGKSNITTGQWWTVVFPGVAISLAVIGLNLISEGIERARELR